MFMFSVSLTIINNHSKVFKIQNRIFHVKRETSKNTIRSLHKPKLSPLYIEIDTSVVPTAVIFLKKLTNNTCV